MLTIEKIERYVNTNGFGLARSPFNEKILLSAGMVLVIRREPERWKKYIVAAIEQVGRGDYGGYYEPDEEPTPGAEYYQCKSPLGDRTKEQINAHWEVGHLILYFPFER